MNQIKNELAVPPAVFTDKNAQELVRIWAAHGQQHVTLLSKLWDDPFIWGMFLVDLANHAANIYEQENGRNRDEVLNQIKQGFEAEWDHPTDKAKGSIIQKH